MKKISILLLTLVLVFSLGGLAVFADDFGTPSVLNDSATIDVSVLKYASVAFNDNNYGLDPLDEPGDYSTTPLDFLLSNNCAIALTATIEEADDDPDLDWYIATDLDKWEDQIMAPNGGGDSDTLSILTNYASLGKNIEMDDEIGVKVEWDDDDLNGDGIVPEGSYDATVTITIAAAAM